MTSPVLPSLEVRQSRYATGETVARDAAPAGRGEGGPYAGATVRYPEAGGGVGWFGRRRDGTAESAAFEFGASPSLRLSSVDVDRWVARGQEPRERRARGPCWRRRWCGRAPRPVTRTTSRVPGSGGRRRCDRGRDQAPATRPWRPASAPATSRSTWRWPAPTSSRSGRRRGIGSSGGALVGRTAHRGGRSVRLGARRGPRASQRRVGATARWRSWAAATAGTDVVGLPRPVPSRGGGGRVRGRRAARPRRDRRRR